MVFSPLLLFVDNYISDDVSALSRDFDVIVIVLPWIFVSPIANSFLIISTPFCKNTGKAILHTTLRQLLSLSIKADWFIGI